MNEPTESLQAGTDGETQTASPLSAFGSNAASAFKQFKSKLSSSDDGPASTSSDPVDSDDFWSDSQTASASQARTESKESESEPFTSRNYNPNQESEWFSE